MEDAKIRNAIDTGQKAFELKQYLETHPYLKQVMERIQLNLLKSIMSLNGNQKDEFSFMKVAYDMVYEPIKYMEMDILEGERASKSLAGESEPGGII